jgi:hypothetical protein
MRQAIVERDGGTFKITGFSGDQACTRQITRHLLRRFVEESRRELDRAEAEDTLQIVKNKCQQNLGPALQPLINDHLARARYREIPGKSCHRQVEAGRNNNECGDEAQFSAVAIGFSHAVADGGQKIERKAAAKRHRHLDQHHLRSEQIAGLVGS